jgi:hypothetical protein
MFRVIENKGLDIDLDSFEEEYLHSDIVNETLRIKYNLSKKQFSELTNEIKNRLGVTRRPNLTAKHYYINNDAWVIHRRIGGVLYYYGRIPFSMGKNILFKALLLCEENNWDCELCRKAIKELKNERLYN